MRRRSRTYKPGSSRSNIVRIKNISGLPDRTYAKLTCTNTSAFTLSGGAASFLQFKLNSIWRPISGTTSNDGGYNRMFADYTRCLVRGSKITIRIWASGASGAVQEPFRVVAVPCTSSNYSTYSGVSNIVTLYEVPHNRHILFSPGSTMPTLSHYCSSSAVNVGAPLKSMEVSNQWSHTAGADPSNLCYWLIGFQAMAGTTTLDLQAEYTITHYCEFFQYIGSNSLSLIGPDGNDPATDPAPQSKEFKETKEDDDDAVLIDDIKKLEEKGQALLIPGHGVLPTVAGTLSARDIVAINDRLQKSVERARTESKKS